jgi:hypothetical protein
MNRLNQRAYDRLAAEIQRCMAQDPTLFVQRDLAYKRLAWFCAQPGTPLSEAEIYEVIDELFPDFDPGVIRAAAKINGGKLNGKQFRQRKAAIDPSTGQPSATHAGRSWAGRSWAGRSWATVKWTAISLATLVGGVWVLNLPYPMIRYPVADKFPIALLPSFISMDHHYRQAIATTEQADQLVNNATSSADFALGEQKMKAAQGHLDQLPVWFLGYYPRAYCSWMQCSWRFTYDEFQQARKAVARMEARLVQEKNAQAQLDRAEAALAEAKQAHQAAQQAEPKTRAIAQWQHAIDQLEQLPNPTLAGRTAKTKLTAVKRDFQAVVGFTIDNQRVGNLIQAAQYAAETAKTFSSKPAHSPEEWQEAEQHWRTAIAKLNTITVEDPDYLTAQKLLKQYEIKRSQVTIRLKQEQTSQRLFNQAQQMKDGLFTSIQPGAQYLNPRQIQQLQTIVATLRQVQPNTTVYPEAQQILQQAQARLPKH